MSILLFYCIINHNVISNFKIQDVTFFKEMFIVATRQCTHAQRRVSHPIIDVDHLKCNFSYEKLHSCKCIRHRKFVNSIFDPFQSVMFLLLQIIAIIANTYISFVEISHDYSFRGRRKT